MSTYLCDICEEMKDADMHVCMLFLMIGDYNYLFEL